MNDVIYQYDGSLDGFLCCVYESYVYKEAPPPSAATKTLSPSMKFAP